MKGNMVIPSLKDSSPLGTYLEHCKKGELAYQVCTDDNTALFYPRAVAPGSGSGSLEWRVSKGLGTVYTTTAIYYKGEQPLNVAMIDLDEGFRMMSRVEDIDATQVKIGMRVKVRMHPGDDKQPPYPVFTPLSPDPFPNAGRGEIRASPSSSGEKGSNGKRKDSK
jgi:uncharacterized OB-fold protein